MTSFLFLSILLLGPLLNSLFWLIYFLFLKFSFNSSSYPLFLVETFFFFFFICYNAFETAWQTSFMMAALKLIRYFNMSVMLVLVSVDLLASWKLRFSQFLVWWKIFFLILTLGIWGFVLWDPGSYLIFLSFGKKPLCLLFTWKVKVW